MIWIYAGNEASPHPTTDGMVRTYGQSGGQAHLYRIDKCGRDEHQLFSGNNGYELWGPLVANYLASIKPLHRASSSLPLHG